MMAPSPCNLAIAAVFAYLTSYADQAIFVQFGIPPVLGQILCLALITSIACYDMISGNMFPLLAVQKRFITILVAYVSWTAVGFLYSSQSDEAVQRLVAQCKVAGFVIIFSLLLRRASAWPAVAWASLLVAVAGSAMAVFDFVVPTFSSVPGRGAGLYLNPNDAGFMLIALAMAASSSMTIPITYLLWIAVAPGILATFSRSAWLLLVVALCGQAWLGGFGRGRGRFVLVGVFSFGIGLLALAYVSGELYTLASGSELATFLDANTVARLGIYGASLDDASSAERGMALAKGLEAFYAAPIFGNGLGYTFEWDFPVSTHNMYVMFLAELGFPAFCLFVGMIFCGAWGGTDAGRLIAGIVALGSLFSHNMLDQPGAGLIFAVAAVGASGLGAERQYPSSGSWAGRDGDLAGKAFG